MPAPLVCKGPDNVSAGRNLGSPVAKCQTKPVKVTLVELVEVVTRGAEGVVTGAGGPSAKIATIAARKAKSGLAFKQYINIAKDVEGSSNRRADYDRFIEVKARVVVQNGDLAGHRVKFTFVLRPGAKRPAGMTGSVTEGFGSVGGGKTATGTTDTEGWTGTISFYLSQYAGDQFSITAEALEDAGNKKTIGSYEVWRRFWYQITRARSHTVASPSSSVNAYSKVQADMWASSEVTYTKDDAPAHTFYPGWMVEDGAGDDLQSVIGGHNRDEFYKKFKAQNDQPVKGHLIICQHQWDPFGESDLLTVKIDRSPSDELLLTLDGGAWNAGIVKPALKNNLVVLGSWSGGGKSGSLTTDNILIRKGRSGLNAVRVSLPAGAPDPAKVDVTVQLKLVYGKFYEGESNVHQMLIRYQGDDKRFNQVVSHEFGHGFGQVPRDGHQTLPLSKHPKQYSDEHGGVGSHCSTDTAEVDDTAVTSGKRFTDGTCIMYHQVNPSGCKQVFCETCEPYLRLQDFSALS